MNKNKLSAQQQKLWLLAIITFGGALVLFLIGCQIQLQYFTHIIKKDLIEPREFIYDKVVSRGHGRMKSIYFSGLIDSNRVEIIHNPEYVSESKRLLIWYNSESKNAIYYREPREIRFNPLNFFWYYFKWFIFTMLPFIIFSILTFKS